MKAKDKTVLVICHSYNSFQKDFTDEISKYFKKIYVFVRNNPFAEISKFIPVSSLDRFKIDSKVDLSNKPSNVEVVLSPVFYGPFDFQYKKVVEKHFKSVEKIIEKKSIKFDLIFTHFLWSAGYVGAKLKEKYNVPFIAIGHGYDVYDLSFRDNIWRKKIEYVLNSADRAITVSKKNVECIKKIDADVPVEVIPNGFRDDLFYPRDTIKCRKKLGLPINKKIILNVGNMIEIKGHKYLIKAMAKVVESRDDVMCIIIGSGHLKNNLKKQIKILELGDYVKLCGRKAHNEMPIWMNAADLFVLPSLNEGNPTVMFEALGCGKPFIGTKVGGIPEIINNKKPGYLVEAKDVDQLSTNILRALETEWNSKYIYNYARKFTWKSIVKEIMKVYESLFETSEVL